MSIPAELRALVRQRANCACEYCGVTETDSGAELTVDHFRPRSCGGEDSQDNLLYCCYRCNQFKADYWPTQPGDPVLWNPRRESMSAHLLPIGDGSLHPITPAGDFTLRRLRLNRPQLVAYRVRKQAQAKGRRVLTRYQYLLTSLEQLRRQEAALLEEHQALLEELRELVQLLLRREE
jgi:hypothetical protein